MAAGRLARCAQRPGRARETLQERIRRSRLRALATQLRIALAAQPRIDVDVLLERERGIEHGLDTLRAMLLDRRADLARMRRGLLDDVLADLLLRCARNSRLFAEKSA